MRSSWTIVCVLLTLIQGCGLVMVSPLNGSPTQVTADESPVPSVSPTGRNTPTPQATRVIPSVTITPEATRTYTPRPPTSTPTLVACLRAGGRVEVNEFTSILLPNPLVYRIYLPPCYDQQLELSYPVLYLIHGQTYSDTQWDRLGAPETADRLVAAGERVPFIIVMPRDRVWREPTEDNFGLAVEQSLIPWVDEHYRTIPDRAHRAIGGLSRGGAWAIHLGLSHPELFSAIGLHSGFVFQSDVQEIHLWLYNLPEGMVPRIYMDLGDKDRPAITASAKWVEDLLTRYDIPHEWHMFIGEHEEAYWQAHVEDYLRWYSLDWQE